MMTWLEKHLDRIAYAGPDVTGGTGGGNEGLPPGGTEGADDDGDSVRPDGPGSGRSALRKSLEKGFRDARQAEPAEPEPQRDRDGKYKRKPVAGGLEPEELAAAGAEDAAGETKPADAAPAAPVPDRWSKDEAIKAAWAKADPALHAAVVRREEEMAAGVKKLQDKYADIDGALAPHLDAIKKFNVTPAAAVRQLFDWFGALSMDAQRIAAGQPAVAFPALAKSYGIDIAKLAPGAAPVAGAAQPNGAAQPGADAAQIDPVVAAHIGQLNQQINELKQMLGTEIGGIKQNFQRESEAKTNEILSNWAKDKPHFEQVRHVMSQLIKAGAEGMPGGVPLKDGQVDLDAAYERAVWAVPEVRAALLAEQEKQRLAGEKAKVDATEKARREAADKARRAGNSLAPGAPGGTPAGEARPKGKGKSVKESLMEAMSEVRGNAG